MEIKAQAVKELREQTGVGILDCKKALQENNGDMSKAIDYLRKKGLSKAASKVDRTAAEGIVKAYIHSNNKIGVLIEVNCETDFVAKNEDFIQFTHDLTLQIAAMNPEYVSPDEIPAEVIEKEREIYISQFKAAGKPENIVEKIAQGKIEKEFYKNKCLLYQDFVKDTSMTIKDLLVALIAKLGENIVVRRFIRWTVGEGIEKKSENFADEVASQINAAKNK
jgi:elongation factor Ts